MVAIVSVDLKDICYYGLSFLVLINVRLEACYFYDARIGHLVVATRPVPAEEICFVVALLAVGVVVWMHHRLPCITPGDSQCLYSKEVDLLEVCSREIVDNDIW